MKVKFLKDHKHTVKNFKKGAVVRLTNSFAKELIRKKIAEETDEERKEDLVLKQKEE